jgi:rare lipoprotein A (peptidoglycan hydrolase)
MPMRRTIVMSIASLAISAGAIAKTPEKSHPGQPGGVITGRAVMPTGKSRSLSCGAAQHRRTAAADISGGAPDPYWGPMHATGKSQFGKAAWYGLVGNHTSNGEILDTVTPTAAHRSLPLASYAKVTNLDTGRSVVVKINDRGPFTRGRIIDLSPRAADEIDMRRAGVAAVVVEPVEPGPALVDEASPNVAAFQQSAIVDVQ